MERNWIKSNLEADAQETQRNSPGHLLPNNNSYPSDRYFQVRVAFSLAALLKLAISELIPAPFPNTPHTAERTQLEYFTDYH